MLIEEEVSVTLSNKRVTTVIRNGHVRAVGVTVDFMPTQGYTNDSSIKKHLQLNRRSLTEFEAYLSSLLDDVRDMNTELDKRLTQG